MKPHIRIEILPSGKIIIETETSQPPFTFRWQLTKETFVEGLMARITTEEQIAVSVNPTTAGKHAAAIDGDVELTVSDPTVVTVTKVGPKAFVLKGVFGSVTTAIPVAVQVVASFDADLGDGVTPVELSGVLEVASPQATTGTIDFGTPELQS